MTKDNVIDLRVTTTLDLPTDKILEQAKGELDMVVVIGWDVDDNLYVASSDADQSKVLWLLEKAKADILMFDGG